MFNFFKSKAEAEAKKPMRNPEEPSLVSCALEDYSDLDDLRLSADSVSEAIASPKPVPSSSPFQPIDAVGSAQTIPGKFDYYSPTWKYLQNYFNNQINKLHQKNENQKLSLERTQVIRGQIKEIKALLKHTNQLAGISVPPANTPLEMFSTGKGITYD